MPGRTGVLAIDTSLNGCGAGLYCKETNEAKALVRPMITGQSEALMPFLCELVPDFQKLESIVVTNGPGAFTGMRIGLSAAKSLALALDIPVFGITTLQALALCALHKQKNKYAVIIDTKREDFYMQAFDEYGKATAPPGLYTQDEIENILKQNPALVTTGDAAKNFAHKTHALDLPDCAFLAQHLAVAHMDFFTENPVPLYLRPADVSQSKKPQRILQS